MLQKPPDGLIHIKGHAFLRSSCLVVFVAEGDLIVFKRLDPMG